MDSLKEYRAEQIADEAARRLEQPLKPCPFCGGEAEIVRNDVGVFVGCFHEICPVAPSTGTFLYEYASEAEAIEAWNTRAEQQKVAIANVTFTQEQLDEIKEYCLRNLARYTRICIWKNESLCDTEQNHG